MLYANKIGYKPLAFKALSGLISRILSRHVKVGINLHGEANKITVGEREAIMADWRIKLYEPLEKFNITPLCVYNGNQTGLYCQKQRNRMYVDTDTKHTSSAQRTVVRNL